MEAAARAGFNRSGFFNAFIYLSLKYTSASNVAILESSIPVVTIAASFFLFQERFKRVPMGRRCSFGRRGCLGYYRWINGSNPKPLF
ncbi:EamA family transporter [Sinobaca sp. H24]|uniref:EamA family transporter n=1 Tax=Sinobaca sp. H24 TaxID=2923376 RepID=UPI00207A5F4C|nr:EamA family transporter [Sinobaca sp. H24]